MNRVGTFGNVLAEGTFAALLRAVDHLRAQEACQCARHTRARSRCQARRGASSKLEICSHELWLWCVGDGGALSEPAVLALSGTTGAGAGAGAGAAAAAAGLNGFEAGLNVNTLALGLSLVVGTTTAGAGAVVAAPAEAAPAADPASVGAEAASVVADAVGAGAAEEEAGGSDSELPSVPNAAAASVEDDGDAVAEPLSGRLAILCPMVSLNSL